jgi:hypothetical protein
VKCGRQARQVVGTTLGSGRAGQRGLGALPVAAQGGGDFIGNGLAGDGGLVMMTPLMTALKTRLQPPPTPLRHALSFESHFHPSELAV